ncbi:protein NRT1/ PTR FAMILY 2.8-like [Malus domestica]|uniref:protein NRT1/ PTR FAMILY 2.8-like n=1 Tax=Malus domestica TaxID=3750 RepID=UPI003976BD90
MEHAAESSSEGLESQFLPPQRPVRGWRAVRYILGNETFEKLASMSLIANLVVYLHTKYHLDNVVSANVFNIWSGSCNIAPLFGAFLADTYLGKSYTLLFSSIASLLGMGTLTLTACIHKLTPFACAAQCQQPSTWQIAILYSGLGLLVVGFGGLRPCNIAFGADQFDTTTEKGREEAPAFSALYESGCTRMWRAECLSIRIMQYNYTMDLGHVKLALIPNVGTNPILTFNPRP